MKDYKEIVEKITRAVSAIKDEKLKEIAFQRLLDDALVSHSPTVPVTITSSPSMVRVEQSNEDARAKKARSKSSSTPYNPQSIRDEVKQAFDDVHAKYPGVRPYSSLEQKWEKYLWALEVGRQKGLEVMTNGEIAYVLSNLFSEGVTERQVNNLTFKTKEAYVQKRDIDGKKAWRILADGINLLREKQLNEQTTTTSN